MEPKRIGICCMLVVALLWALEPIAIRYSYRTATVLQTASVSVAVVALCGLAYALFTHGTFSVTRREFSLLFYMAIAGSIFATTLYFAGIEKLPVVNAIVLVHLQPIFIVLLGYLILREDRLTVVDYVGIGCMILAGIFVSAKTLPQLFSLRFGTLWDGLVLIATFLWATTGIVTRKWLTGMHAGVITAYRFGMAAVVLLIGTAMRTEIVINRYAVLTGLIGGIGYILYNESIKRMKAAQVGALELVSPFFAAGLGFAILGESVMMLQIMGMVLLCLGVYFLAQREETL